MREKYFTVKKMTLRLRFIFAISLYSVLALILWLGYYQISYSSISRIAKENTILAVENLIEQISADFEQMNSSAAIIAGSSYVQDFLLERNKSVLYEKAVPVSEIISKTAFPITSSDSVITINMAGDFYRFSGGLDNQSCQILYDEFKDAGTVYTIVELGDALYFCYNTPVFDLSGLAPERIGSILMLTGINRTRRTLENLNGTPDIDTALILDGEIVLSNNTSLEYQPVSDLEDQYGVVSTIDISGTPLAVAAAIPDSSLFPDSNIFMLMFLLFLGLMVVATVILYNYLSRRVVRPMADSIITERQKLFDAELVKQKMQMGLLSSQIDAHFVFNTLTTIESLADKGDNEKTAQMASGLAVLLRNQQKGDTLANVFEEFQVLEKYIKVMNIRFDDKFSYDYDLDENLSDCLIPGFILQPIVENALAHGLHNKDKGARLHIRGTIKEQKIYIDISDNGIGIPPGKLKAIDDNLTKQEIDDFPEPGLSGVALMNIQRRIRLRFGDEYGVKINSEMDKGTTVTVVLPFILDQKIG